MRHPPQLPLLLFQTPPQGTGAYQVPRSSMSRNDGVGLSGRGALAGVVGGEVANVCTITLVVVLLLPEVFSIRKLDMVTWGAGVGVPSYLWN